MSTNALPSNMMMSQTATKQSVKNTQILNVLLSKRQQLRKYFLRQVQKIKFQMQWSWWQAKKQGLPICFKVFVAPEASLTLNLIFCITQA